MFRMAVIAYKRGDVRRKSQHETHSHELKVEAYQLSRLVEVMVADVHPVFGHALKGLSFQVAGEGDGLLLGTSHHWYSEKIGVEVVHADDQGLPLVKGAPVVNDFPGSL